MWNPFVHKDSKNRKERIADLDHKVAVSRTNMYSNLMTLEDMVRRSLILLEPKKNEPDR